MKRHSKKRFDALKRIFAILLVCAMLFSNVTSTVTAMEALGSETATEEQNSETQDAASTEETEVKETSGEEPASEETPAEESGSEEQSEADPATADSSASEPEQEFVEETESSESEQMFDEETAPAEETTSMPEAYFEAYSNKVFVKVYAPEGAFPEGTQMKVTPVADDEVMDAVEGVVDGTVNKIHAVDITFYLKKDENTEIVIEPQAPISVSMNAYGIADEDAVVVHVPDEGDAEVIEETTVEKDGVTFESDAFSVYVVVETVVPRLTVNFVNGGTTIETMYVKKADTAEEVKVIIHDPGAGTIPAGQVFKGWTTDPEYTSKTTFMTIDEVRTDAMTRAAGLSGADDSVTYYAAIFKQYTITYVDGKGITVGTEVAEIPARETEAAYTVNMGYSTDDSHNFEGWIVIDGQSNVKNYPEGAQTETVDGQEIKYYTNGTEITITGNVKFSVDAPEGHWLIFDENGKGATYNAPRFIKAGEVTSDDGMLDMVRNGYKFVGWYTERPNPTTDNPYPEPTGSEFAFGGSINETTTIYAKWEAISSAQYTVLIWKQNVAGNDYDFVEAVHPNGTVGTTPTAVNTSNGRVTGATYNGETGFHFKSTDQASKKIAPEGNTVVNVYYDRNEYTLTFQVYDYTYTATTGNNGTQYGIVNGEYVELTRYNGAWYYYNYGWRYYTGTRYTRSRYQSWQDIKTITALYGQNIRDYFPIVGSNGVTYTGASWSSQNSAIFDDDAYVSYIDVMQAESTTFRLAYNPTNNYYTYHVKYYVEALPEDSDIVTYNGIDFTLYYDAVIHFQSDDLYSTSHP